jgi:phosphate transport system substrate-binding protein
MQRVSKMALGLAVAFGLGCAAQPAAAQMLPNDLQLRLAGSSTIGGRLMQEVITAWAKKIGLTSVRVNAGMDADEYEITAERAESTRRMRVEVKAKGTGSGIEPLLRGQADFWMASRQVQDGDLERARSRNLSVPTIQQFMAPGSSENIIGLDALAIVVNGRNPVKRLTFAQIRDMYTGRTNNWSQVGGPNLPVGLYALEGNHGTSDVFCGILMNAPDVAKCLDSLSRLAAPRFSVEEDMPDAVANNPAGIGYVGSADRRSARPLQIGTECGTGVDVDSFRIKADEYPLSRRLYLYQHPTRPLTPGARAFLDYITSTEGQAAISKAGFADLNPAMAPESYGTERLEAARDAQDGGKLRIRPTDVRAFEESTAGASRLSITYRFQSGTNNLDSRAEADLLRLADMMKQPAYAQMQVVLIGYSGATGDYAENRTLSKERADAVRDRLANAFGIKDILSLGVGPAAAVACNLDPKMASLNQRVEVWLRKKS